MNRSLTHTCIILLVFSTYGNGLEPFTTGTFVIGALGVSVSIAGFKYINCIRNECCDNQWIDLKSSALEEDLHRNLFGQHFVKRIIPKSLRMHVLKTQPKKALVLSFHGWTGCGKNHVSQMIVKNLFLKGSESQYHHLYVGSRDFPHKQEVNKYRDRLRRDIEEATQNCDRSLFIFDEVDKMAPGILDALKPYVDYHENLNGVDYRKNIFILLSNAGGNNITEVALKFWSEGKNREDIALKDVESIITRGAFNEPGGLWHSEIVKRDLIDVYVPFLPLEKRHVRKCTVSELRSRGLRTDAETVERVVSQLVYGPGETELFSVSGCKKIYQKVDLFGTDEF